MTPTAVLTLTDLFFTALLKYRKKYLDALDRRTSLLTEIVHHLQSIKLFAYKPMFYARIDKLRLEETGRIQKSSSMNAAANVIDTCMPAVAAVGECRWSLGLTMQKLMMIVTFTVHVAMGRELDLGRIFATNPVTRNSPGASIVSSCEFGS